MPTCTTCYHGAIEYEEAAVVHLPRGLFGFAAETRFLPLEQEGARPLVFLQSLATPELCFLALPVFVVDREYVLTLAPDDLELLGFDPSYQPEIGNDVMCLALLSIIAAGPTTANLLAPVVINLSTNQAVQAISLNRAYSHVHPFLEPAGEAVCS